MLTVKDGPGFYRGLIFFAIPQLSDNDRIRRQHYLKKIIYKINVKNILI